MRLYLAVAVLMLAFVAYTEAQEETIERRFSQLGEQIADVGQNIAEKAKAAFEKIRTSKFAVTSSNWLQEQFRKMKPTFEEISQ